MTHGLSIEFNHLSKSFEHKQVLKNIHLSIPAGQFVAIIGKSGCGKSTLLRIVAGLEEQTSGECIKSTQSFDINEGIRIMFQEDRLLPWLSVVENVGVGSQLTKGWQQKALASLEQVGLSDRAKEWPHVLSGGQKQRVALARALSADPQLLLLDEPLGALDALTRLEMQKLIENLWLEKKYTSLLVTHDVSEAIALADRIILIEDGKIALDVQVDLPRPRSRTHYQFTQLEETLLNHLLEKTTKHQSASNVIEAFA